MKLLLHYPKWGNRWEPYLLNVLKDFDLKVTHRDYTNELIELTEWADVLMSAWCNDITLWWSHNFPDKKIITYLRRYEIWEYDLMNEINFEAIDAMIFVSKYIRDAFHNVWNKKVRNEYLIPNGIDFSEFTLRNEHKRTNKIAMVCQLRDVKNIPLALQILRNLPNDYTIHHCGLPASSQYEGMIESYMYNLGLGNRFFRYGSFNRDDVLPWLMDKDIVLCTSINEGNPHHIIESMAMGIRPIIHNWPRAKDQFPHELIFETVDQAVHMIQIDNTSFTPKTLREYVTIKYDLSNFDQVKSVVERTYHGDIHQQWDNKNKVYA